MKIGEKVLGLFRDAAKVRNALEATLVAKYNEREAVLALPPPPEIIVAARVAEIDQNAADFERQLTSRVFEGDPFGIGPAATAENVSLVATRIISFICFCQRGELERKIESAILANYPKLFMGAEEKKESVRHLDAEILELNKKICAVYAELEAAGIDVIPCSALDPETYLDLG